MVPATVPMVTCVAIAGAADGAVEDVEAAAAGADESLLPLQPATAREAAARRAATAVRRGPAGRLRGRWKGGKPRSFPVGFGGAVAGVRRGCSGPHDNDRSW